MPMRRLALAVTLLLAACGTFAPLRGSYAPYRFMQQQHREAYAMTQDDLEKLQFFTSTKVLAHDLNAAGSEGVVLVDAGTPGVAVASGPNWIRVSFQQGGPGVVFLAQPTTGARDSQYSLATEGDEGTGYQLVRLTKDRILRDGTRRYQIIEGADAHLVVDQKSLTKVVDTRRKAQGREPGN
jgi:hypothetical protein